MKAPPFLPRLDVKKDPDALLRLFVTTAVASMIVIISLAGYGFHQVLQRYMVSAAEKSAITVSSALLAEERNLLVTVDPDGSFRMNIRNADRPWLDWHIRTFLAPFGIVKIKIYSAERRIVYSTEAKIIGRADLQNPRLENALAGHFDSKLERKEEVHDLADEVKFQVDVVETYIPVRDQNGKVFGSFEIYQDITKERAQFRTAVALSLGLLALILGLVFGLSFFLIRGGTRDLKEIQEMLREQAITDSLTGIFNKRQILLGAHREFSRACRRREKGQTDAGVGLIMLDIDRFKLVNDSYGHLAGDLLLKELAARVSSSLRAYDSVGRFGGEEFLVVLPGADLEQSRAVALKIWTVIREEPFLLEGNRLTVTASLGVAASQEGDAEYVQVLKRADDGLYRAKSGGRDRIA